MPQSIPAGLTKEYVLRTLADIDAGIDHHFGKPTGYELVHNGKRYAPKTVAGLAFRYVIGRILKAKEFSGGEAPGQANFVLRRLGFTVVPKGEDVQEAENTLQGRWTQREVGLIVIDYLVMLEKELFGKPFSKTKHRRALAPSLNGRSDASIEFKHANISAILTGLGLPYVEGYKPRGNYQNLLAQEVNGFLDRNPSFLERLASGQKVNPYKVRSRDVLDLNDVIETPPARIIAPAVIRRPWLSRKAQKIDFVERDAANRKLGQQGEEFVLQLERHRLNLAGRDDLAQRVLWASRDHGDGLGFDIISYNEADDTEEMLEVKATGLGKFFPFYVSANEVRCSEDIPLQYQLFRVFDFGRRPRLYILHGSLRELCQLEPVIYRART